MTQRIIRLRRSLSWLLVLSSVIATGCGEETINPSDPATGGAGTGGGTVTSGTGAGGEGGSSVLPDGCYDRLAAQVDLLDVSLFQVVDVPLLRDREAIPGSVRPAPVVQNRPAVVRAGLDVGDGFEARELGLRVTITTPSGTRSFLARDTVAADSSDDPNTGLRVELPADALTADATYVVSVVECEAPTAPPSEGARFPRTGDGELDAIDTGPLKIHILPFEVNGFVPDTSPGVIEGLRERVYSLYPTDEVQITVGPVVANFASDVDVTDLLVATGQFQEQSDPVPTDVYYYGLYTGYATREAFEANCDCATGSSQELFDRAGFAIGAGFGDARAEDTLIHELGHLHGLPHAPCGEPSNVDPLYPHADADIGSWGWDVRTETFVPSDHKDMMAYCYPRWVSAYHYGKVAAWMEKARDEWMGPMNATGAASPPVDAHHCFGH